MSRHPAAPSRPHPWSIGALTVLAVASGLFFWRIGAYSLVDGDAASYARMARSAAERDEWLLPSLTDDPHGYRTDKPPLALWIMAASFRLLGTTEFAARAWHAALAVLGVGVVIAFAQRRLGGRAGPTAGLILASSALYFYLAREPLLDIPLTVAVTGALVLFDRFRTDGRPGAFLAGGLVTGLGVLVKGPVVLVLVAAVLVGSAWLNSSSLRSVVPRSWRDRALGLGLVLAPFLAWYAAVWMTGGARTATAMAGSTTWARFLIHDQPPGVGVPIYGALLLVAVVPWTGVLVASVAGACRRTARSDIVGLALAWMLVPVLVFGLSPRSAFIRYLLPGLPGASLLMARWLSEGQAGFQRTAGAVSLGTGAMLFVAALVVPWPVPAEPLAAVRLLTSGLGIVAACGGVLLWFGRRRAGALVLGLGSCLIYVALLAVTPRLVDVIRPERHTAAVLNTFTSPGQCVVAYRPDAPRFMMLSFYVEERLRQASDPWDVRRFLGAGCAQWVIESQDAPLPDDVRASLRLASRAAGGLAVWRVETRPASLRDSVHADDPCCPR